MTIPGEVQQALNQLSPVLETLRHEAEALLRGTATAAGARFSSIRIKPLESIYLKAEKECRDSLLGGLNDLVAATLLVPDLTFLPAVSNALAERFIVVEQVARRAQRPEEFGYHDVRFLVRLRELPLGAARLTAELTIEVQVKTEMQHASAQVSRQLEYKTKRHSWHRVRLASKIRALVEMVDDLLQSLATESEDGAEQYERFMHRNRILDVLAQRLEPMQMPEDWRRLALVIEGYLNQAQLTVDELDAILAKPEHARLCTSAALSAVQTVFVCLFVEKKLTRRGLDPLQPDGTRRFIVTREMEDLCPQLRQIPMERRVALGL